MVVNKMGGVHPVSTSWAIPSAYEKQNDGESGPTVGRSFRHYEGHRPDVLQGSWWGTEEYLTNVLDCIRFATWNIGTMSGRSAEVVETLHRRKIDVKSTCLSHVMNTSKLLILQSKVITKQ